MNVSIRNYKSIRSLDFESRRVNVFIGEPNCGKSNVIEALSLMSLDRWEDGEKLFRCTSPSELFWDAEISNAIAIKIGENASGISPAVSNGSNFRYNSTKPQKSVELPPSWAKVSGLKAAKVVKRYEFQSKEKFPAPDVDGLLAPYGENLAALLGAHRDLRIVASEIFSRSGFRIEVRVREKRVSILKDLDGVLVSYPFTASSETLRRILFYRLAVETNQNSVLLFDEPEANTFPMFTKLFAEQIAADDHGNTFFLTTHSPYLLGSLIEKTPKEELAVVLCHMENFETKARVLNQDEVQGLLDLGADAFFNLDRLTEE